MSKHYRPKQFHDKSEHPIKISNKVVQLQHSTGVYEKLTPANFSMQNTVAGPETELAAVSDPKAPAPSDEALFYYSTGQIAVMCVVILIVNLIVIFGTKLLSWF